MHKFKARVINKKIKQFDKKKINVEEKDIIKFLNEVVFKTEKPTKKLINDFIKEDNTKDIVNFLMSDAIINPKTYNGK